MFSERTIKLAVQSRINGFTWCEISKVLGVWNAQSLEKQCEPFMPNNEEIWISKCHPNNTPWHDQYKQKTQQESK